MKIDKKLWFGSGGTPNKHVQAAIAIAIGKRAVVLIGCSQEGKLNRVYVKQKTGTSVGFDVRVVDSKLPYGDEAAAAAAYNAATAATPELFDVIAKQTATSGNAVDFRDPVGSDGPPFINQDSDTQSNRERKLYLVIIPTNTPDASTWEATVTYVTSQG